MVLKRQKKKSRKKTKKKSLGAAFHENGYRRNILNGNIDNGGKRINLKNH